MTDRSVIKYEQVWIDKENLRFNDLLSHQPVHEHLPQAPGARLANIGERRIEGTVLRSKRIGSSASAYTAIERVLAKIHAHFVDDLRGRQPVHQD